MSMENNKDHKRFCEFLRTHLPGWKDVQDSQMSFHLFSSITNKVYKVTAQETEVSPNPVILRNFCGHEGIVDKDKETKVFDGMSKGGFGPECYGHEGDIRLEQFIPSRTIHPHEYKERVIRRKLARTLAALNTIDIPDIDRTSMFEGILQDDAYFKHFEDKCEQDIYTEEEKDLVQQLKTVASQSEKEFMKSILPLDDIVFSHNDLLQGNVLITEAEEVKFIDYEYAAYNFRGYDIGNMFKEATFDYSCPNRPYFRIVNDNFPDNEALRDFLRYYIGFSEMKLEELKESSNDFITNDDVMKDFLEKKYQPEELERKVDDLLRKTMIGVMLSHYYWLVWGIKMHKTVDIQFDYLAFAKYKYEQYNKLKKELFNQ